jgi:phage-related tail protein
MELPADWHRRSINERIEWRVWELRTMVSEEFARLARQIEKQATVTGSAVELLKGLADKIGDLANHPSAADIRKLADQVKQNAKDLAAAIAMHEDGEEKDTGEPAPPEIPEE